MITSWMVYACLVTALFSVAAVVLERLAATRGWPVRFVWIAALFLSVVWPVGDAIRRTMPASMTPVTVLPFSITVQTARVIDKPLEATWAATIDRSLVFLWCAFSGLLFVRLMRGIVSLQRTRRGWLRADIDGTAVRLSPNIGPAVVGLRSMDVVVPQWITTLDASLRAIVLRHEEEHRLARDPYLLLFAALAVVFMPWNLALWLQSRRLRLAIEMDCDARVLRVHRSAERYGLLMMTIAQRRSVAPSLFAPMLSEPATQLERRIIAMQNHTRRLGRIATFGGVIVAVAVLAFACSLQSDSATGPRRAASLNTATPRQRYVEFTIDKPAQPLPGNIVPEYPDPLRAANIDGEVLAQFVVDTNGLVDMRTLKILRSTHDLFAASARDAVASMRFTPAEVGGRHVKQLMQAPFYFHRAGDSAGPVAGVAAPPRSPTRRVRGPTRMTDNQTYFDFQVEKAALPLSGNTAPRYPDALRSAGVEGEVLAEFVVGTNGRADTSTFKALKSTHALFTGAVRNALPALRFSPATVGGMPIKQLVQVPFQFNLSK